MDDTLVSINFLFPTLFKPEFYFSVGTLCWFHSSFSWLTAWRIRRIRALSAAYWLFTLWSSPSLTYPVTNILLCTDVKFLLFLLFINLRQIKYAKSLECFWDFVCTQLNIPFDLGNLPIHLFWVIAILFVGTNFTFYIDWFIVDKIAQVIWFGICPMHTISPLVVIHCKLFGFLDHLRAFYWNSVVAKSFFLLESIVELSKNLMSFQVFRIWLYAFQIFYVSRVNYFNARHYRLFCSVIFFRI